MESRAMTQVPLGKPASWPAPAKLNLCLHIVGRRSDGYHLLQSAIQFIDLCDQLRFYRRPPGLIERVSGPTDVLPEADLVIRAARLLAATGGSSFGVGIELDKKIPMQAGLGGGSSDAATVLVALNRLWNVGLTVDQLSELGLKLGADVPVFVRGEAAWMEGNGEVLTPADFETPAYLVIKPAVAVSTAEIFHASELTRNTPVTTIRAFREQGGHNDCAATVCGRYPKVAEALDWLGKYAPAKLTGTGACIFAALPDAQAANRVRAQMPAEWQGFVVQGLNRSPLLARLEAEERDK
jgi:4-diphosphocytidyl-2-C-methyl-D-erythritol kinase